MEHRTQGLQLYDQLSIIAQMAELKPIVDLFWY